MLQVPLQFDRLETQGGRSSLPSTMCSQTECLQQVAAEEASKCILKGFYPLSSLQGRPWHEPNRMPSPTPKQRLPVDLHRNDRNVGDRCCGGISGSHGAWVQSAGCPAVACRIEAVGKTPRRIYYQNYLEGREERTA